MQIQASSSNSTASMTLTWNNVNYTPKSIELASAFSKIQHIVYYNVGRAIEKLDISNPYLMDLVVDNKLFILQLSQHEDIHKLDMALKKFKAVQNLIQARALPNKLLIEAENEPNEN
jgi:hypothetical protein